MSLLFPCSSLSDPSNTYHYNRTPGTADGFDHRLFPVFYLFYENWGVKIMLKLLLGVVRQVIAKLMNQLILTMCL